MMGLFVAYQKILLKETIINENKHLTYRTNCVSPVSTMNYSQTEKPFIRQFKHFTITGGVKKHQVGKTYLFSLKHVFNYWSQNGRLTWSHFRWTAFVPLSLELHQLILSIAKIRQSVISTLPTMLC